MNVSKNTSVIKILIFLLIAGAIAGIIIAITNSDSETKTTPSPSPDIEAKWVAVGEGITTSYEHIMYSSDGKTWTKTSSGDSFSSLGYGVAYGTSDGASPLWVAVGDDAGYGNIMYSTDGENWTKTSSGDSFSDYGFGVAYGTSNGVSPLWVAVGNDGGSGGHGTIMYSSNGKNWTKTSSGDSFSALGRGVAYGTSNGVSPLWVAVGNKAGYGNIMYSSNGQNWKKTSSGDSFSTQGYDVAYGTSNGVSPLWVAVGSDGPGGGYGTIMYSSNGKEWEKTSTGDSFSGTFATGYAVAYGASDGASPLWVAVGNDPAARATIMYSNNGKVWTKGSELDFYGYGVAFDQVLYGMCTTNYHP